MNIKLLEEEMDKKHVSVSELARMSNVDKSTISRLLNEQRACSIATAQAIVQALDIPSKKAGLIFLVLKLHKCNFKNTTNDCHRKEISMDHERRIKDLEDRVRSLNRSRMLMNITILLLNLNVLIQIYRIGCIQDKLGEIARINSDFINLLKDFITHFYGA